MAARTIPVRSATSVLLLLTVFVAAAMPRALAAHIDMSAAPADEYFGAQNMSAIGIRMRVDKLGRRYHARTISDADLLHDAAIAESALRAWAAKYPRDPWLAPTSFHLEQLDQTVQSAAARVQATALLKYIAQQYGKTRYGHLSRLRLAQGFPPLHDESVVVATPNPYASAVPSGAPALVSPAPAPSASAAPGQSPTPAAAPSVTPSPR